MSVPDAREGMGRLEGELGEMGCGVFGVSGVVPGWWTGGWWVVIGRREGKEDRGMGWDEG
jgi:hypothetical protein